MTPLEAEKPENLKKLKIRFEIQRKTGNPQEKLKVGDTVRYFKKKDTFTKGYEPQYSEYTYKIEKINKSYPTGQKKYVIDTGPSFLPGYLHYKKSGFDRSELEVAKRKM